MKSSFNYPDTNASRAKITDLTEKFKGLRIAIIGLGGTGSYVLDLVAKTQVAEIHLFDNDVFELHNAFRAPGAVSAQYLDDNVGIKKVQHHFSIYSLMHSGIKIHPELVTAENVHLLKGFDFVFLCVDKNSVRHFITTALLEFEVPFIDVGLGVERKNNALDAGIRVTVGTKDKSDHLVNRIGKDENEKNEYDSNIQIADLNCLNAALAVIKWKKLVGFYFDLKHEHNTLWFSSTNKIINEDNQKPT